MRRERESGVCGEAVFRELGLREGQEVDVSVTTREHLAGGKRIDREEGPHGWPEK
jgi:hypothetical protein